MPETVHEFSVASPAQKVKERIFSAVNLGTLFHTVQRVEGDEDQAEWYLKTPFRATLGAASLKCTVLERGEDRCRWEAKAEYLRWQGEFVLIPEDGATRVRFSLEIVDSGPLATVHNAMIAVQIRNVVKYFERKLKESLEAA